MKNKKKGFTIAEIIIISVVLVAFLSVVIVELAAPASSFGEWIKTNIVDTSNIAKSFMTQLGMPDIHLHCLRHTNASMLISAGVDVRTVAGRLGHANPSTTLNIYSHFYQAMDNGAADALEKLLSRYDVTSGR